MANNSARAKFAYCEFLMVRLWGGENQSLLITHEKAAQGRLLITCQKGS